MGQFLQIQKICKLVLVWGVVPPLIFNFSIVSDGEYPTEGLPIEKVLSLFFLSFYPVCLILWGIGKKYRSEVLFKIVNYLENILLFVFIFLPFLLFFMTFVPFPLLWIFFFISVYLVFLEVKRKSFSQQKTEGDMLLNDSKVVEKDIIEKYEKGETVKKATSEFVIFGKVIGIAFLLPLVLFFDFILTVISSYWGVGGSLLSYFLYPLLFWRKGKDEGKMLCMILLMSHIFFTFMVWLFRGDNIG